MLFLTALKVGSNLFTLEALFYRLQNVVSGFAFVIYFGAFSKERVISNAHRIRLSTFLLYCTFSAQFVVTHNSAAELLRNITE